MHLTASVYQCSSKSPAPVQCTRQHCLLSNPVDTAMYIQMINSGVQWVRGEGRREGEREGGLDRVRTREGNEEGGKYQWH